MRKALTELDHRLLALVRANGRESFVNLAEALGSSEGTVRAHIKRLTDQGVICRFTVRTRGANLKALIEIQSDTNVHTSDLTQRIADWPGVEVVYEVSGNEDLIVIAEADDTDQLDEIIEKIRKLPNVRSTRSRLILKETA